MSPVQICPWSAYPGAFDPTIVGELGVEHVLPAREKGINATDIAKMLGVSRATVYCYLADEAT